MYKAAVSKPVIDLTRQEYLARPVVTAFCTYLKALFKGKSFRHRYDVNWSAWAKYLIDPKNPRSNQWGVVKRTQKGKKRKITQLRFKNLKGAYDAYYWPTNSLVATAEDNTNDEEDTEDSATCTSFLNVFDRTGNARQLSQLRNSLIDALNKSSAEKTFFSAVKILDWGQVYKGSVAWLIKKHENNELVKAINKAVKILDGDNLSDTTLFEKPGELRIDSGLTKVYSLASEHSIIYDDRVSAALGLLVVRFLIDNPTHKINATKRKGNVPEELKFICSKRRERNPSFAKKGLKFRSEKGGALQAQSNLMANWILREVAGNLPKSWVAATGSNITDRLRAMESTLFILGYRVK